MKKTLLTLLITANILHGQSFTFDGYKTDTDSYTNKEAIYFYNGHKPYAYGTKENPLYQTYLHWGVGTDDSETTGERYFFMYAETPIEVKNMIWGSSVTASDILEYDLHFETHHAGKDPTMDFSQATGSEYISFQASDFNQIITTNLITDKDNIETIGQIAVKDSVDYLIANGATEDDSNAGTIDSRTIGMAFEYKFELDTVKNAALLTDIDIIEYHLSPERGLVPTQVPEPNTSFLFAVGVLMFINKLRFRK